MDIHSQSATPKLPPKELSAENSNKQVQKTPEKAYPLPPNTEFLSQAQLNSLLQNIEKLKQYVHELNVSQYDFHELDEYKAKFENLLGSFQRLYKEKDNLETKHFETKAQYQNMTKDLAELQEFINRNLSQSAYRDKIDLHLKDIRRETDQMADELLNDYSDKLLDQFLQARIHYHNESQKYEFFLNY
ncbi:hypothetical protein ACO0QE_002732 [Hanseniaspora vineae]